MVAYKLEKRTYDVWGNARDGWEVNDSFASGTFDSDKPVKDLTDPEIKEILGIHPNVKIDTDGDEMIVYVNRRRDGYPLGEIYQEDPSLSE
jgi:hypothetical protein